MEELTLTLEIRFAKVGELTHATAIARDKHGEVTRFETYADIPQDAAYYIASAFASRMAIESGKARAERGDRL